MPSDLFSRISSELGRNRQDVEQRAREQVVTVSSAEADRLGRVLYSNLKTGGFCTYLVTGHRPWGDRSADFEGARSAAKRGCKIERAFLLPDRCLRHDPNLKQHLDLDFKAGIRTLVLYVGDLIEELAACSPGSLEFGVWDREMCSMAMYGAGEASNGPSECRVSARDEDVRRGRRLADILRKKADAVPLGAGEPTAPPRLEEPIFVSAPIGYRVARRLCRQDSVQGPGCSHYHGLWQYLRIFNTVSTPAQNADFFLDALSSLAREGGYRRVLVSGTADYSMPAHVLWAYQMENVIVDVTVVDICESPLHLSRWYAKRVGAAIKTHACDIFDYECVTPFDIVCTHGFFGQFTLKKRKSVVAKWRQLLRPGGKAVITGRIVSPVTEGVVRFRSTQVVEFRKKVLRAAEMWRDFLDVDIEELGRQAELIAKRRVRTRIPRLTSGREIAELFEAGGFAIDRLELVPMNRKAWQPTPGLKPPKIVENAQIVATRL